MITKNDTVKYTDLTVGEEYTIHTLICETKSKLDNGVITDDYLYYQEGVDKVLNEQYHTFKPEEENGVVTVKLEIPEGYPSVTVYHQLQSGETILTDNLQSYTLESKIHEKPTTVIAKSKTNGLFGISLILLVITCLYFFKYKPVKSFRSEKDNSI